VGGFFFSIPGFVSRCVSLAILASLIVLGMALGRAEATVLINEFMASNGVTVADEDGDFEDWVELHNSGEGPVDLGGWGLSDRAGEPFRWAFAEGTVIEAGAYLLVWASGKDRAGLADPGTWPHTNFRIASSGEDLLLTRPDGSTADFVAAIAVPRDVSRGRRLDQPSVWAYFYNPTPAAGNTTTPFASLIEPVVFSHPAGAYSGAFDLQLSHPDPEVSVVFTLDGSEPDIDNFDGTSYLYMNAYPHGPLLEGEYYSTLYSVPIQITDRSPQPNSLAMISSTADADPGYLPTIPINKATVVRARAYRDGVGGPIRTYSYFVSAENAFDYRVPIVSLSMNADRLFDYFEGIYVAGVDHVTSSGGRICNWGNYNRRGRSAERAAHVEFFAEGIPFLSQSAGMRIQGNCSRRLPFKSLRLYARPSAESAGIFDYPFFEESFAGAVNASDAQYQRLMLRTPNYYDTAFSRLYQGVYEGVLGRIQPVKQFINGEYWGVSLLRDRFDVRHLEHHYGLNPDKLAIIDISYPHEFDPSLPFSTDRIYTVSAGVPQDLIDFEDMRAFIIDHDMADPARYAEAGERICLDSFIDHLILKIFAGDDHYAPEVVYWRSRVLQDDGLGDARWRFHVKDFDSTLHPGNFLLGLATGTHPRPFGYELFASLLDSPAFRTRFINRFSDLLNSHFLTARFEQIIDQTFDEIAPLMGETNARWNAAALTNPDRPFNLDNRDSLLAWAQNQPDTQRYHIRSFFDIQQERPLTVQVNDDQKGRVRVNTLLIDKDTPGISAPSYPWTGLYFPGHPVPLTAEPTEGQRFKYWLVTGVGGNTSIHTTKHVSIDVDAVTHVEAVFGPALPTFLEMVAESSVSIDLREWFGNNAEQEATVFATNNPALLSATISGHVLTLTAHQAGEASFTVEQGEVAHTARVLIYGAPVVIGAENFFFDAWPADAPAATYPAHMLFTQSQISDPDLDAALLFAYHIPAEDAADPDDVGFPYAATARTRINGLGERGIQFINTGRGRDLGAAVLSLDTTGANSVWVAFTAGTELPNSRQYAIRLQYRVGLEGEWQDVLDSSGQVVQYARNTQPGHSHQFPPLLLPDSANNQPTLLLRWKYHYVSGTSGPRAALRLDNIAVSVSPLDTIFRSRFQ